MAAAGKTVELDDLISERDNHLTAESKNSLLCGLICKRLTLVMNMSSRFATKKFAHAFTQKSLSGTTIRKVALPRFEDHGEILRWLMLENVPGSFPFTAGVFAFKREGEDPTRMFAGEGDPYRTNRRFKLVSQGMDAKRLSTAFDSVTLYGADPAIRPDIYGKIGNSGVSVATLEDMKVLTMASICAIQRPRYR